MTLQGENEFPGETPSILCNLPELEFENHQEFLFRHVDFLADILTAEQFDDTVQNPAGCPSATPEIQAHRLSNDNSHPCKYRNIPRQDAQHECICGDPLNRSDDPLDTVAAVAIAENNVPPAERYFDHEYRNIVANLRENVGSWDEIGTLSRDSLAQCLDNATNRPGIASDRVIRLYKLLHEVRNLDFTDGITLVGVKGLRYSNFAGTLSDLRGISRSDAWWLMLVAFDKPVWPSGPIVDGMLTTLGFIHPDQLQEDKERRVLLEEELTDRQIPQLHRAIAGHAVKNGIDTCGESCEARRFFLTHRLRQQEQRGDEENLTLIDLFSGAGGLSLGFSRDEWEIELAIDNDQDAIDTYRLNHPEIPHRKIIRGDIREEIENGLVEQIENKPDLVVGGPPCQSLSQAGYRSRLSDDDDYSILDDERTDLYQEYVDVVKAVRPKAILMENVEGMVNEINGTGIKVGDLVVDAVESIGGNGPGYVCDYELLNAARYGIPQERERVFFVGIREDLAKPQGREAVHDFFDTLSGGNSGDEIGLKQALSGLPKIRRGEGGTVVPERVRGRRSKYLIGHDLDTGTSFSFNHQAREHPMEKDQMLFDEALGPGDTGWDIKYRGDGEYADLIEYDVGTEENPRFKDKYRMLKWHEPAPTVVAHLAKDSNNFILPAYFEYARNVTGETDKKRNRGVTPREAARIQSFPDDFIFLGSFTAWFRQIGNAVPPVLGQTIASTLSDYLQDTVPAGMINGSIAEATND